jgi:hypothetical protein
VAQKAFDWDSTNLYQSLLQEISQPAFLYLDAGNELMAERLVGLQLATQFLEKVAAKYLLRNVAGSRVCTSNKCRSYFKFEQMLLKLVAEKRELQQTTASLRLMI